MLFSRTNSFWYQFLFHFHFQLMLILLYITNQIFYLLNHFFQVDFLFQLKNNTNSSVCALYFNCSNSENQLLIFFFIQYTMITPITDAFFVSKISSTEIIKTTGFTFFWFQFCISNNVLLFTFVNSITIVN